MLLELEREKTDLHFLESGLQACTIVLFRRQFLIITFKHQFLKNCHESKHAPSVQRLLCKKEIDVSVQTSLVVP
jgi:hypothetical protein